MKFERIVLKACLNYSVYFYEDSNSNTVPTAFVVSKGRRAKMKARMHRVSIRRWYGTATDDNGYTVVVAGQKAYVADWCLAAVTTGVSRNMWPGKLSVIRDQGVLPPGSSLCRKDKREAAGVL